MTKRRVLRLKLGALGAVLFCASGAWAGTCTIINNSWNGVHVEVRVGRSTDPTQNPVVKSETMNVGDKWRIPVPGGGDVYYRRDNGPWTRKAVFGDDNVETTL